MHQGSAMRPLLFVIVAFSTLMLLVGWPVKNLVVSAGVVMCLEQGADLHMAQVMLLTLTISCSSKSRLVLASWFYLSGTGSPG